MFVNEAKGISRPTGKCPAHAPSVGAKQISRYPEWLEALSCRGDCPAALASGQAAILERAVFRIHKCQDIGRGAEPVASHRVICGRQLHLIRADRLERADIPDREGALLILVPTVTPTRLKYQLVRINSRASRRTRLAPAPYQRRYGRRHRRTPGSNHSRRGSAVRGQKQGGRRRWRRPSNNHRSFTARLTSSLTFCFAALALSFVASALAPALEALAAASSAAFLISADVITVSASISSAAALRSGLRFLKPCAR